MQTSSPVRSSADGAGKQPRARLRILETTDLHMQLLAYDYFADHAEPLTGLVHLAGQIAALRAEKGVTTLLFDNGDFLQGNPLADHLACQPTGAPHPMIAAFNTLDYDAITLGNHEFNYGLPYLRGVLKHAQFPVTCANIQVLDGPALAQPFVILYRDVTFDDGTTRQIKIGVIGFVTPQISTWDKAALAGRLVTDDIIASAKTYAPQIKAAGADVVIALCHSGIGCAIHIPRMENVAVPLAAVDGIDVILTGHTHEVFPGGSQTADQAVDPTMATLHGKPAVMAGFYGNCLGVIDLDLDFAEGGVRIAGHRSRLQKGECTDAPSALQDALCAHVQTAHDATLRHIRQPIARTDARLHSYFSSLIPDMPQQLLATAQQRAVARALSATVHRDLPVLSATAPFRYGGRAGPGHFIDIPPGPLALRDAAAIYPFTNTLCAVRRTGAQLRLWLETAASHFCQIKPGIADQPLINPQIPAYNCDTIFGLTYLFDLTESARIGPDGSPADPGADRLRDLRYQGRPVADDDVFVVATNSYRANGGGGFAGIPADDILHSSTDSSRDILIDDLRQRGTVQDQPMPTWRFTEIPDTSAVFQSAPAAKDCMPTGISHAGPDTDGFDLYRLTF